MHSLLLRQLNDLRGHVHIADPQSALRYTRLLTAPATWFLWRRTQLEVEIIEGTQAYTLPNFGLRDHPIRLSSTATWEGIRGGFRTTQWQYDPLERKMQLVRHTYRYGRDADTVLKTMSPPDFSILGNGMFGILSRKGTGLDGSQCRAW